MANKNGKLEAIRKDQKGAKISGTWYSFKGSALSSIKALKFGMDVTFNETDMVDDRDNVIVDAIAQLKKAEVGTNNGVSVDVDFDKIMDGCLDFTRTQFASATPEFRDKFDWASMNNSLFIAKTSGRKF
jgi:hypothetical protein